MTSIRKTLLLLFIKLVEYSVKRYIYNEIRRREEIGIAGARGAAARL
jgi:hypothetical protein